MSPNRARSAAFHATADCPDATIALTAASAPSTLPYPFLPTSEPISQTATSMPKGLRTLTPKCLFRASDRARGVLPNYPNVAIASPSCVVILFMPNQSPLSGRSRPRTMQ